MMQLAWLTDIHLNFLETNERKEFYNQIITTQCEGVLISGDIAEAPSITDIMKEMAAHIQKPIYFVLGNHDYYRGTVAEIKKEMTELTQTENSLYWLPASGSQVLMDNTVLLGQDGWADGRYGDYANSNVALNDSQLIDELFQEKLKGKYALLEKMQALADADAIQLTEQLEQAIHQHHPKKIIIVTHVPPFKEACTYQGKISNDDYLPYFGSKATGDALLRIAKENLNVEFLVLCGHTHGEANYKPLENLTVKVGKAQYYRPQIQKIIEI